MAKIETSLVAIPSATAPAVPSASAGANAEFASLLADLASAAGGQIAAGETAALAGIAGNKPLDQVVNAVMAAEQALAVTLAIRDKAVAAYTEINHMPI